MPHKINYYDLAMEEVKKFKNLTNKPRVALHACCAPCSSHTLEYLTQYFDVTIIYENSNVFPLKEFEIRRDEIKWFVDKFNKNNNQDVKIVFPPYDHDRYMEELRPLSNEPEGGQRCKLCYAKHIRDALQYASNHKFDYACTTLTISRQKNSQPINEIAREVAANFPDTKYFYSDFKKKGGLSRVNELKEEYNLYQQEYCGCEYSLRDRIKRVKEREKESK